MSECIKSIQFEHFRGLPRNDFALKGRNLVLLGSNGKGKSAVVDGIEFVFSGRVNRFQGTASIKHNEAVQHIKKLGTPKVTLRFSPSNGTISRSLDSETLSDKKPVQQYIANHPGVEAFILRRTKILDFVSDHDADRYQKFIRLLGVTNIDTAQRIFVEAEKQTKDSAARARAAHMTQLAVFKDPTTGFNPLNLGQILGRVSGAGEAFGLEPLSEWAGAGERLELLKAMRPEANKVQIDALTRAIISLKSPLPGEISGDIATVNRLSEQLTQLGASSTDAPRSKIIAEGTSYLIGHPAETHCPLCEEEFPQSPADVLARLKQRGNALSDLREASSSRAGAWTRLQRYGEAAAALLAKDLEHSELFDADLRHTLRSARADTLCWLRSLKRIINGRTGAELTAPQSHLTLANTRSSGAALLELQKVALVPPDASKLEAAIALLERGIAAHEEIALAETALAHATELFRRAGLANTAFSTARESAIQKVFDTIADTVLNYYQRLHDCAEVSERSECTALVLKANSRAAAGGLKLAIHFLGLTDAKDPRAFLSEGHLDSLGLCLFLATVRKFNPPGSLLVMDDVLTSIDRDHRRRVGELLFQEFSDYQIVLTTHDEHWHDLLSSSTQAWGVEGKWTFVKVESWTVDSGPAVSEAKSAWDFIDANLDENSYRQLGGPFRLILEDFLKRCAAKLAVKVVFKIDGKYTAGDFYTAGIHTVIRTGLLKCDPTQETEVGTEMGRVFGQGDLINFLSHDNPSRLEVTLDQAKDFVQGVRALTKRLETHKLIKGK